MSVTTQKNLDGQLRRVARAARACGIDTEGWALHGGSKVNGVSFRLATGSRLIHLGTTKSDAWQALDAMGTAFEMVENAIAPTDDAPARATCRNCGALLTRNRHEEWEDSEGGHACAIYGGQIAHLAVYTTPPQESAR